MRRGIIGGIWKMKRILFVGNSHVGALNQGLKLGLKNSFIDEEKYLFHFAATAGSKGITCDSKYIFINPNIDEFETHLKHFKLVAGAEKINFLEFDVIIAVLGNTPLNIRNFIHFNERPGPISYSLIEEIIKVCLKRELDWCHFKYISKLLNSSIPIIWCPKPCEPFELNLRLKSGPTLQREYEVMGKGQKKFEKNLRYYKFLDDPSFYEYFRKLYKDINLISEKVYKEVGFSRVLLPGEEVLHDNLFQTKSIFSKGSKHFALGVDQQDYDLHMNADYGLEIMLSLIKKLH